VVRAWLEENKVVPLYIEPSPASDSDEALVHSVHLISVGTRKSGRSIQPHRLNARGGFFEWYTIPQRFQ
jgi:hypothetical protein